MNEEPQPQIFIIGLPRSGTTLVYQYVVHRLQFAYFTNGVGRYPKQPCLITFIQRILCGKYKSDFRSSYGKVTGFVSPREAGSFWCRFFDVDKYMEIDDLSSKEISDLKRTISCIQKLFFNAPFVNKNVKHMLRVSPLSKIFPNSKFLIVERCLKNVGISLLRGRYQHLSNPDTWWSVRPPNYEQLKVLPREEQVAYQVISLKKRMDHDLSKLPSNRVIRVDYNAFCEKPEILTLKLENAIGPIKRRNPAKAKFIPSTNYPENIEEFNLIRILEANNS